MNFGDHAQALQPVEIARREDLRMNQSHAAVARAVGFGHCSIMSSITPRLVADGMDGDLDVGGVGFDHHFGERAAIEFGSAFWRNPGQGRQWPRFFFSGSLL